jgi:TRAP transporter TAXI family solute receptor
VKPITWLIGLISLAVASAAQAQPIGIGTMGQGTLGYSIGAAIATVLQEKGGIQARIQPAAGTSAYLPLIDSGELDFGIANAIEARGAIEGTESLGGRKLQNLRFASVLFPFKVAIFVRKDSPINSIADLKGKRLTAGFRSQATIEEIVTGVIANGALTMKDVTPVLVPNVVRGADDFAAGKADAAFFAIGSAKVSEVDAAVGGVRFLPLDTSPAAVKRMPDLVPGSYVTEVQPRPGLAGIDKPIPVMAYDYVILTGKHVPPEQVEKAMRVLAENKEALVAAFAAFNEFDPKRMAMSAGLPVHPGAETYFKNAGLAVK